MRPCSTSVPVSPTPPSLPPRGSRCSLSCPSTSLPRSHVPAPDSPLTPHGSSADAPLAQKSLMPSDPCGPCRVPLAQEWRHMMPGPTVFTPSPDPSSSGSSVVSTASMTSAVRALQRCGASDFLLSASHPMPLAPVVPTSFGYMAHSGDLLDVFRPATEGGHARGTRDSGAHESRTTPTVATIPSGGPQPPYGPRTQPPIPMPLQSVFRSTSTSSAVSQRSAATSKSSTGPALDGSSSESSHTMAANPATTTTTTTVSEVGMSQLRPIGRRARPFLADGLPALLPYSRCSLSVDLSEAGTSTTGFEGANSSDVARTDGIITGPAVLDLSGPTGDVMRLHTGAQRLVAAPRPAPPSGARDREPQHPHGQPYYLHPQPVAASSVSSVMSLYARRSFQDLISNSEKTTFSASIASVSSFGYGTSTCSTSNISSISYEPSHLMKRVQLGTSTTPLPPFTANASTSVSTGQTAVGPGSSPSRTAEPACSGAVVAAAAAATTNSPPTVRGAPSASDDHSDSAGAALRMAPKLNWLDPDTLMLHYDIRSADGMLRPPQPPPGPRNEASETVALNVTPTSVSKSGRVYSTPLAVKVHLPEDDDKFVVVPPAPRFPKNAVRASFREPRADMEAAQQSSGWPWSRRIALPIAAKGLDAVDKGLSDSETDAASASISIAACDNTSQAPLSALSLDTFDEDDLVLFF